MNTLEDLIMNYGLSEYNACEMLTSYGKHIGCINGDYVISDITYIGEGTIEVEEECLFCHTKIVRSMRRGRNKWSELKRMCECQNETRKESRKKEKAIQKEKARISALQNEIGKLYGEFKVIGHDGGDSLTVECQTCGAVKEISYSRIADGTRKDFKCHAHRRTVEKFTDEYIGMKKNRLTVTKIIHGEDGKKKFVCLCDCGKEVIVKPSLWDIGKVVSCGCYLEHRSDDAVPLQRIKGIYRGMRTRCLNKNCRDYKNYGGRGVSICDEWLLFKNFLDWSLENGYDNTKTIDRIDPNGNYEPSNCRWTTWDIQCRNRRPRRKVMADGKAN